MRFALPGLLLAGALAAADPGHAPPVGGAPPQAAARTDLPGGPPREARVEAGGDLSAALAALPAGSSVRLGAGVHAGPVVVDRPLSLVGEPGAVVQGPGRGTVLSIVAPDVRVADLRVTGGGANPTAGDAGILVAGDRAVLERVRVDRALIGIDLRQVQGATVRDCHVAGRTDLPLGQRGDGIRLWESRDNLVQGNRLEDVRDLVVWYSDGNRFVGNEVTRARYGTHFMHADDNVVSGSVFRDDVVGVFVMYSRGVELDGNLVTGGKGAAGVGLGFKESEGVIARGNRLVGNTTGIYLDTTPQQVGGLARFEGNLVAYNDVGLRIHGSQVGAQFVGNSFHENLAQVAVDGRGNALGSRFTGNAWSDYAGYDLDRDGYGDLPHELRRLSDTLRDRRPAIAFFAGTPAAGLLDLLGAAFPMFGPAPLARDERPAMRRGGAT